MKQKKLNNILYVFDVNPYIITQDTSAEVIKVQEESYDGFVEMNPSLAEKIIKYNYHLMCVKVPEWAPYAKEEDPQVQLTFGVYGADASTYIEQIQRLNASNVVLQHWDAPNITFPFQCNVNEGEHCAIEFKDGVNPSELDIVGDEYISIRWEDQETGHYWASTAPITESISVGFNSYEPGGTVLNISGENTVAIRKLEVYDHEGTKYDEWYADTEEEWEKQLTFPFSTPFAIGDYFKFDWDPSYPPFNQTITGIEFENQWYNEFTYSWWTQTYGLEEAVNMTVNSALDPETSWSAPTATVTIGADDNVFPTLSNPHNVSIVYWSSDSSVAAIDLTTGVITLNNAGTTTIGANCTEQGYGEYPVTYTLTVQAAQPSTYTVTLSGTDILQNATVKMDDVTVSTQSQYQNVADGTVVDVYPTGSVADYTLVSGAVWDTDHWTATVNGADLAITINYLGAGVNFNTRWDGYDVPENVSQINIGNISVTGNDLTDLSWTDTVRLYPGQSQIKYFISTGLPTDMETFMVIFNWGEYHYAHKQTDPVTGEVFYIDEYNPGAPPSNPGIWTYDNNPDSGLPWIAFTIPSVNEHGNAYSDNTDMGIKATVSGS